MRRRGLLWAAIVIGATLASFPAAAEIEPAQSPFAESLQSSDPSHAALFALACISALENHQLDSALTACDHAVASDPRDAQLFRLRGGILLAMGEYERAGIDYSLAIEREPANPRGYELRGLADLEQHLFGAALSDFNSVIALVPNDAAAWNVRCWVKMLNGKDLGGALSDCQQALRLDPENGHVRDTMAWVYLRLRQPRLALANFDAALAKLPKLASSLYGRGLARMALGNVRTGSTDVSAARKSDPAIDQKLRASGLITVSAVQHRRPELASTL